LGMETARTVVSVTLTVLERAMFDWPTAVPTSPSSKTTVGFSTLGFLALMIPWPLVATVYIRRVYQSCLAEPRKGRRRPMQPYLRTRA
jgi:hypothetical protein